MGVYEHLREMGKNPVIEEQVKVEQEEKVQEVQEVQEEVQN